MKRTGKSSSASLLIRMIDLGFEEIVNWILDEIPSTNLKSQDEATAYQQVRRLTKVIYDR